MKKDLNVLIVEDEIIIAEAVKLYLSERGHSAVDILVSYEETIELLQSLGTLPDIVLLDVRLYGEKSGIDVANYLNEFHPEIPYIFLTSQYDRRIVENALATNPGGYLAKPIQKETLWTTLELAYYNAQVNATSDSIDTLEVSDGSNTYLLKQEDILYILADHVYVKIFTSTTNMILMRSSLQSMFEKLSSELFLQSHRSAIANLAHVESYDHQYLRIAGEDIPLSRNKRKEFLERIKRIKN